MSSLPSSTASRSDSPLSPVPISGFAPPTIMTQASRLMARQRMFNLVVTNVPGPQMPLYLAGSRIDSQMFWVPQTGSIGMGISILSYDGAVHFGLIADRNLVPDPGRVIAEFAPEFEKLLLITLMGDWGGEVTAATAQALCDRYCAPTPRKRRPTRQARPS